MPVTNGDWLLTGKYFRPTDIGIGPVAMAELSGMVVREQVAEYAVCGFAIASPMMDMALMKRIKGFLFTWALCSSVECDK
jgi:hypothetical protein